MVTIIDIVAMGSGFVLFGIGFFVSLRNLIIPKRSDEVIQSFENYEKFVFILRFKYSTFLWNILDPLFHAKRQLFCYRNIGILFSLSSDP